MHEFIHGVDFPADCRIFLLDQMARIECVCMNGGLVSVFLTKSCRERLAVGGSERLQLSALVGAFRVRSGMGAGLVGRLC